MKQIKPIPGIFAGFFIKNKYVKGSEITPSNSILGTISSLNLKKKKITISTIDGTRITYFISELSPMLVRVDDRTLDYVKEDVSENEAWTDLSVLFINSLESYTNEGPPDSEDDTALLVEDTEETEAQILAKTLPYVSLETKNYPKETLNGFIERIYGAGVDIYTVDVHSKNSPPERKLIWKTDFIPLTMVTAMDTLFDFESWVPKNAWEKIAQFVPTHNSETIHINTKGGTTKKKYTSVYSADLEYEEKMKSEHEPMFVCYNVD